MIRPRFIIWLVVLITSYISASTATRVFPHVFIIFLIWIPIISVLSLWINYRFLNIKTLIDQFLITRDQPAQWRHSIQNTSKMNTIELIIDHQQLFLKPEETYTIDFQQTVHHVGTVPAQHDTSIKIIDVFGLFTKQVSLPSLPDIVVIPFLVSVHQSRFEQQLDDEVAMSGSPFTLAANEELDTINPLEPNAPMKWVHWKLSARLQDWMIKSFHQFTSSQVTVILQSDHFDQLNQRDQFMDFTAYTLALLLETQQLAGVVLNQKHKIQNQDEALLMLGRLEDRQLPSLETQLNVAFDASTLNLVLLSNPSEESFSSLLNFETYFDRIQVILFHSKREPVVIPQPLQSLTIHILEYQDEEK